MKRHPSSSLLLFGATGDLAKRMLLPSLYALHEDELIAADLRIVGTARSELSDEEFRALAKEALDQYLPDDRKDEAKIASFLKHLQYQPLDASTIEGFDDLAAKLGDISGGLSIFLSTAPFLFEPTIKGLKSAGLAGDNVRIGLEKPLGTDLASSAKINDAVASAFSEDRIFRIDHYLGKETVQNLLVLRFANVLFEPLWSRNTVDHVQITVAESVGLEDRADYYDNSGALRDMVQNHLLQLLCLTAMEPPNSLDADDVRTEKIKVLKALRRFTPATAASDTVRAQYNEGVLGGKVVKGYVDELPEEKKSSRTETFVAIKTYIDNWRWQGVPFYLRTGKRMKDRRSEIVIRFKRIPHSIFDSNAGGSPNKLVVRLQPNEGVNLYMKVKEPGPGGLRIKSLPLNLSWAESFVLRYPDAYERLLMDVVRGNLALFMQREEVEKAWEWVDTLLAAWSEDDSPLESYPAGTDGPTNSAVMLAKDKRRWLDEAGSTSMK